MLIDIDAAMRSGKGAGYERWAKVFNVKQLGESRGLPERAWGYEL